MKETFRLVGVMAAFCAVAGLLLAWANQVTSDPIEEAARAEKRQALREILKGCDNDPEAETVEIEHDGRQWTFFIGRKGDAFAGVAFESASEKGYGGPIRIFVGLSADGKVQGVKVLQADGETPGLGARIKEPSFLDQFIGRPVINTRWAAVAKDGGEIQAITGATISSRAVAEAIRTGLEVYSENAAAIRSKMTARPSAAAKGGTP